MPELEQELRALAHALALPEAPDVAARVRARLEREPATARRRLVPRRALVLALALLLIGAAAVLAASPSARDTVRRWIGLRGVRIERVTTLPAVPALPPGPALPAVRPVERLRLGVHVAGLAAARSHIGFAPLVPSELGDPDEVWVDDDVPGGRLVLLYRPRGGLARSPQTGVGALVSELRGGVAPRTAYGKMVGLGGVVVELKIDGQRAIWITGPAHAVVYRTGPGLRFETTRLAGNTLLLEQPGGLLVRIEAGVSQARAVEIARSLRAR